MHYIPAISTPTDIPRRSACLKQNKTSLQLQKQMMIPLGFINTSGLNQDRVEMIPDCKNHLRASGLLVKLLRMQPANPEKVWKPVATFVPVYFILNPFVVLKKRTITMWQKINDFNAFKMHTAVAEWYVSEFIPRSINPRLLTWQRKQWMGGVALYPWQAWVCRRGTKPIRLQAAIDWKNLNSLTQIVSGVEILTFALCIEDPCQLVCNADEGWWMRVSTPTAKVIGMIETPVAMKANSSYS